MSGEVVQFRPKDAPDPILEELLAIEALLIQRREAERARAQVVAFPAPAQDLPTAG